MKYTNNYHLPQWSEDDLILMDDFNKAMANMENGIDGARAEAQAGDAELDRKINAANAKAEAAQAAAGGAYSPSFKPYATGSFRGAGKDMEVVLGFRPSFIIISGLNETRGATIHNDFYIYSAITAGESIPNRIIFTDTGFVVTRGLPDGLSYPNFTLTDRTYDYIAFR